MRCDYFHILVSRFLDSEASEDEQRNLREHLNSCTRCLDLLKRWAGNDALMQEAVKGLVPPEGFERDVMAAVEAAAAVPRKPSVLPAWAVRSVQVLSVAAVALVAVIVSIGIHLGTMDVNTQETLLVVRPVLCPDSPAAVHVMVRDRRTETPVKDAIVSVELRGRSQPDVTFGQFVTSASGAIDGRIRIPDLPDGTYEMVVRAESDAGEDVIVRNVSIRRSLRLLLATDGESREPGGTIHMRALTLGTVNRKPPRKVQTIFEVVDPRGNVLLKRTVPNSEFGVAVTDFTLGDGASPGDYWIRATCGGAGSARKVRVKQAVASGFRLEQGTDRRFYLPGEKAGFSVEARYTSGKPAAGGSVAAKLSYFCVDGFEEIRSFSGRLDESGRWRVEADLPAVFAGVDLDRGNATLEFDVFVDGGSGQVERSAHRFIVAKEAVRVVIVPEGGTLARGVDSLLHIVTSYQDGSPAKTTVSVTAPGGPKTQETSGAGLASFTINPSRWSGRLDFRAVDAQGRNGTASFTIDPDSSGEETPGKGNVREGARDFVLRTEKTVYAPGEDIKVSVISAEKECLIFLDVLKDRQAVLSQVIEVRDGRGEAVLCIPAETAGSLFLCACKFRAGGEVMASGKAVIVEPVEGLRVKVVSDRKAYGPGERARLDISVVDADGSPVRGALCVLAESGPASGWSQDAGAIERSGLEVGRDVLSTRLKVPGGEFLPLEALPASGGAFVPSVPQVVTSYPEKQARIADEQVRMRRFVRTLSIAGLAAGFLCVAFFGMLAVLRVSAPGPAWRRKALLLLMSALFVACVAGTVWFLGRQVASGGAWEYALGIGDSGVAASSIAAGEDRLDDGTAGPQRPLADLPEGLGDLSPLDILFWQPLVVTDDGGRVREEIPLAGAGVACRVGIGAMTSDGRFGVGKWEIAVLRDFRIEMDAPEYLTVGDEVSVPVSVFNCLDREQRVDLEVDSTDWCETTGERTKRLDLPPNGAGTALFRVRATKPGGHGFKVVAWGRGRFKADAMRTVEVIAPGRGVEIGVSGRLRGQVRRTVTIPEDALKNSAAVVVRIQPDAVSQALDGLDEVMTRAQIGCFDDACAAAELSAFLIKRLRETGRLTPETSARLEGAMGANYQKLLGFQLANGEFSWFGTEPGDVLATAMAVQCLAEMGGAQEMDSRAIDRAVRWLAGCQNPDGSWTGASNDGAENVSLTAHVAWCLADAGPTRSETARPLARALDYLRANVRDMTDQHVAALCANAVLSARPSSSETGELLCGLRAAAKTSGDLGEGVWWEGGGKCATCSTGALGRIGTTALAVTALWRGGRDQDLAARGLEFLCCQGDARGGWGSARATVLAARALTMDCGPWPAGEIFVQVVVDGTRAAELKFGPDDRATAKLADVSDFVHRGDNVVEMSCSGGKFVNYLLDVRYNQPWDRGSVGAEASAMTVKQTYAGTMLFAGESVSCAVEVKWNGADAASMFEIDLPIPPGFRLDKRAFERLVAQRKIETYRLTARRATLWTWGVSRENPMKFEYSLIAGHPGSVVVPGASAFELNAPDRRVEAGPVRMETK
jgi:hypothetical protein